MSFRVFVDDVQMAEVCEFREEHNNGKGPLSVTIKFNVKKLEFDGDVIRVTTFNPPKKIQP